MSPATVSRITAQLIEQGIVVEERIGLSTGGRPPVMLKLDYEKLCIIGIRLMRDQVSLGVFDLNGQPIYRSSYIPYGLDPDFFIRELHDRTEDMLTASGLRPDTHVLGVGLAVAGVVRGEQGVVVRSVNLGWRDVPIAERLEHLLGLPVFVENDANAGALAELWFGQASQGNVMYVKTDNGVGAGIILEEQLLTGPRGMVGEIGHIPIVANGHPCRCGQRGCLETYVYLPEVLRRYAVETGREADEATFFDSAKKGEAAAVTLLREAEHALTVAFAATTALLDLDAIIVEGAWCRYDDQFLHRIETDVKATIERTGLDKPMAVRPSGLGEDSDLLGAVGLVSDRLFNPSDVLTSANNMHPLAAQMTSLRG